jgi:hypothetical protein
MRVMALFDASCPLGAWRPTGPATKLIRHDRPYRYSVIICGTLASGRAVVFVAAPRLAPELGAWSVLRACDLLKT